MLLLVHTITMTVDELEVSARFYHTVSQLSRLQRVQLALVGKQMAVMRRNKLSPCKLSGQQRLSRPHFRQSLRAVALRGSVSVEQRSPLRATVSSANPEQPTSSQACQQLQCLPTNSRSLPVQPTEAIAINNNLELGLSRTATVQQANAWLQSNRFSAFLRTFSNFSGLDLLRLSCENLIQICGLPEGIRLYNALHRSPLTPRLTLYMCVDTNIEVYHALFLESLTSLELCKKLAALLNCEPTHLTQVLVQGPAGIHVIVSDEVVNNMKDEAIYMVEVMQGQAEQFCLLLKPTNRCR